MSYLGFDVWSLIVVSTVREFGWYYSGGAKKSVFRDVDFQLLGNERLFVPPLLIGSARAETLHCDPSTKKAKLLVLQSFSRSRASQKAGNQCQSPHIYTGTVIVTVNRSYV